MHWLKLGISTQLQIKEKHSTISSQCRTAADPLTTREYTEIQHILTHHFNINAERRILIRHSTQCKSRREEYYVRLWRGGRTPSIGLGMGAFINNQLCYFLYE